MREEALSKKNKYKSEKKVPRQLHTRPRSPMKNGIGRDAQLLLV